jgi:hypothetical protein
LPPPKILILVVVLLVTIVALTSLAYPSINVSRLSTQSIPAFVTLTNSYSTGYPESSSTIVLAGYSTSTAWYPGNPFCDPASMACTPQPLPTSTITYTQSSTYLYPVTVYSELSTTYTSESIALSTQTSYQTLAPYAAAGLSDFQYGLAAMVILAMIVAVILFVYAKGGRPSPDSLARSTGATRYCTQCGTGNARASAVCSKCGAKLE